MEIQSFLWKILRNISKKYFNLTWKSFIGIHPVYDMHENFHKTKTNFLDKTQKFQENPKFFVKKEKINIPN